MKDQKSNFGKFLLLWSGELISSIGGGLTSFGLGVYVFASTGSAAYAKNTSVTVRVKRKYMGVSRKRYLLPVMPGENGRSLPRPRMKTKGLNSVSAKMTRLTKKRDRSRN